MNSFFCNHAFDKRELKRLIHWFLIHNPENETLKMIDQLKYLGFHHATKAGISLGIEDLKIPPLKNILLANARLEIRKNTSRFSHGYITAVEKSQKNIDIWNTTSELLKEQVIEHFRATDLLNPVYMMAFSGARGNMSQVRQLAGMRGLMSDPQGEIIDLPIQSNFREGLTVTEYIISCYGARKGLVDTALKTANSGYLTRRLVDVAQALIINEIDCGTKDSILLSNLRDKNKILLTVEKRLVGRVLGETIQSKSSRLQLIKTDVDSPEQLARKVLSQIRDSEPSAEVSRNLLRQIIALENSENYKLARKLLRLIMSMRNWGSNSKIPKKVLSQLRNSEPNSKLSRKVSRKIIALRNTDICPQLAKQIVYVKKSGVRVRSPLTCQTVQHICKLCYGWSLARGGLVDVKEAVGIIAAQSIGEPGTQLTMRTFHTGGVFSTGVVEKVYSPHNGIFLYTLKGNPEYIRTPYGQQAICFPDVKEVFIQQNQKKITKIELPENTLIFVKSGKRIFLKQIIAEFSEVKESLNQEKDESRVTLKEVAASFDGKVRFHHLIKHTKTTETKKTQVVDIRNKNDALISVIAGQVTLSEAIKTPLVKQRRDFFKLRIKEKPKQEVLVKEVQKEKNESTEYFFANRFLTAGVCSKNLSFYNLYKNDFLWVPILNNASCSLDLNSNIPLFQVGFSTKTGISENYSSNIQKTLVRQSKLNNIHLTSLRLFSTSALKNENRLFSGYCYQDLYENEDPMISLRKTFPAWFYIPKKKKTFLKMNIEPSSFHKNFNLEPLTKTFHSFTKIIDRVQFNEPVFFEYYPRFCFKNKIQMCSFRKVFLLPDDSWLNDAYYNSVYETQKERYFDMISTQQNSILSEELPLFRLAEYSEEINETTQVSFSGIRASFEITQLNNEKQCLVKLRCHDIYWSIPKEELLVKMGSFVFNGDKITQNFKTKYSGRIVQVTSNRVVLRRGLAYRLAHRSLVAVNHRSIVHKGKTLFHLEYKKEKTEDIVQGLPRIEELLEVRRTKDLELIVNNPHDRLKSLFESYKKSFNTDLAAKKSLLKIQEFLVNGVQLVYQSQGVTISDKHVEIIVKQMTSKVFIEDGGQTPFLCGDLIELDQLKKVNQETGAKGHKMAMYEPILLGITKASLQTESFLSAASFQETTRVLTQAAVQGKVDHFKGLKENVIIGRLIPAGTGGMGFSDKSLRFTFV